MRKMLIASGNQGKIEEVKDLLSELPFQIMGLEDFSHLEEVEEDGNSFKENSLKKARINAEKTGLLTLADDSGLEVDYLRGRPGIYSSRFAGEDATDEDNNKKLLNELEGVRKYRRTARFRCVMALVDPSNDLEITTEGTCEGYILEEPKGEKGFGYDPLFLVPAYGKTMAELGANIKNKISHRSEALKYMRRILIEKYTDQDEFF